MPVSYFVSPHARSGCAGSARAACPRSPFAALRPPWLQPEKHPADRGPMFVNEKQVQRHLVQPRTSARSLKPSARGSRALAIGENRTPRVSLNIYVTGCPGSTLLRSWHPSVSNHDISAVRRRGYPADPTPGLKFAAEAAGTVFAGSGGNIAATVTPITWPIGVDTQCGGVVPLRGWHLGRLEAPLPHRRGVSNPGNRKRTTL